MRAENKTRELKAPWGVLRRKHWEQHDTLPPDLLAIKRRLEAMLTPRPPLRLVQKDYSNDR